MMHRTLLHALSLVLAVAVVFSDIQPGYLDFDNLPETNFSCDGKVIGGYYADVETGCQMFHVCTIGQKGETSDIKFLCLNGTVFDQETRVCERIDEVDCDKSEDFFNLNLELYGNTANFGAQDCGDEECDEDDEEEDEDIEDAEYDDDIETTTIITTTTTERTTTTTTTRPTTLRTTPAPTQPRTQSYPRFTTQPPDSIATLLALHNAFNQGLNRRPILNPVSSTRLPSITSTTTRRPTAGSHTLRTRFGSDHQNRHDPSYVLRPRPTFQPTFTSSLQTPLKSNYHTFESGDTHFAHSFDPDKPYHFQYFSHKSSPSPFTVRIEPEVSVVTSTSTSTSIRIANTTVDETPYEDYDGYDSFFHDVQKITRPKRSTTQRSSSRALKKPPDLNLDNFFDRSPDQSQHISDHVIKIDPSDILLSKNYTSEMPEPKSEYLTNMLDSIDMENTEKSRVLELIRESEPEMENLISSKGVDMMLEKLENKLLEMELDGGGAGMSFQYEGDTLEIREKRGSDNKSLIGNNEQILDSPDDDKASDEIICKNPEFCIDSPDGDIVKLKIEGRKKRSTRTRVVRVKVDRDSNEDDYPEERVQRRTTESPNRTTKKSRRKGSRTAPARATTSRQYKNPRVVTERSKTWNSQRNNNVDRKQSTTETPNIKPVTEEIENDVTTAEYRRSPLPTQGKIKKVSFSEHTTPYSIPSSTRLQTRFDYDNKKTIATTTQTTRKPTYYRQVPVYEDGDYPEIVELEKNKSHKVRRRNSRTTRIKRSARPDEEFEGTNFESVPIRRTHSRTSTRQRTQTVAKDSDHAYRNVEGVRPNSRDSTTFSEEVRSRPTIRSRTRARIDPREETSFETKVRDQSSTRSRTTSRDPIVQLDHNTDLRRDHQSFAPKQRPVEMESLRDRQNYPAKQHQHSVQMESFRDRQIFTPNQRTVEMESFRDRQNFTPNQETVQTELFRDRQNPMTDTRYETGVGTSVPREKDLKPLNRQQVPDRTIYPDNTDQSFRRPVESVTRNVDFDRRPATALHQTPRQNRRKPTRVNTPTYDRNDQPQELTHKPRPHSTDPQGYTSREDERTPETPSTTLPPTPYTPGPNIEADPNFSCRGLVKGGLYADVYADCHGFFICSQAKRGITATHFWCGVGTRFNQKSRTCQAASQVDCSQAQRLYYLNSNQYNPSIDVEEKLRGSFEPMKV